MSKKYFENVIGQDDAKEKLGFWLQAYEKTGIFPNTLLVASKGQGKTHMAEVIGKALQKRKDKPFYPIDAVSVNSVGQLFDDILLKVYDEDATLFFDECHEFKPKVMTQFLTILSNNKNKKNRVTYEGIEVLIDFSKLTFMFATTEPQRLIDPFKDRLEQVNLEDYDTGELAKIVRLHLDKEIKVAPTTMKTLSEAIRQNARGAFKVSERVEEYCTIHNKKNFAAKDWASVAKTLHLKPLGLSGNEVKYLSKLNDHGEMRLGVMASRLALTSHAVSKDIEPYLIRMGLIRMDANSHRVITPEGKTYLKALK